MAKRLARELTAAIDAFHHSAYPKLGENVETFVERRRDTAKQSLCKVESLLREAQSLISEKKLVVLVERACGFETEVMNWAYSPSHNCTFDYFPIYSGERIHDPHEDGCVGGKGLVILTGMYATTVESGKRVPKEALASAAMILPKPFDPRLVPSANSSHLASFKIFPSPGDADNVEKSTQALREARCEILSTAIPYPIQVQVNGGIFAIISATGIKEKAPHLRLGRLSLSDNEWHTKDWVEPDTGHVDLARELAIDGSRNLVWTADDYRIKSIKYSTDNSDTHHINTLDSSKVTGPIYLLDDGARLIRAGQHGVSVWNVDSAPTYDQSPDGVINGRLGQDVMNVSRWIRPTDGSDVEVSKGSGPDALLRYADNVPTDTPLASWVFNPSHPNKKMICSTFDHPMVHPHAVFGLDLETGQRASQYFGHGGFTSSFSTLPSEPHIFLTSCFDGAARLYDIRLPTAVNTLYIATDKLHSSRLVSSGGSLYAFVGGLDTQQIRLYDLRNKQALYKLSTGNNNVMSLAWDESNNSLYAGTRCSFLDTSGNQQPREYRRAFPPDRMKFRVGRRGVELPGVKFGMEDIHGKAFFENKAWPSAAWNLEDTFRALYDAGGHRLFRYTFKTNADVTVIPDYGDAPINPVMAALS